MNGTVIQRILSAWNAEEAGTLLEGRRTQTGHLLQLGTGSKGSILAAIFHDILGKRRSQTAHIGQEMLRCGIQVDTH